MCGIVGFFGHDRESKFGIPVHAMTKELRARGPDDVGFWIDEKTGLALGHARLSILELSDMGAQPMLSFDGRYVTVFNGEIYNHLEIRNCLPNADWKGGSDTETLLAAISFWGIEKTLKKIIGMFAFAVFDRKHNQLYLARDRFGEKPLYFGWQGRCFMFGSELKALTKHPCFSGIINSNAVEAFLRVGYVPTPLSIWSGIQKLEPGCYLKISTHDTPGWIANREIYWNSVDEFLTAPIVKQPLTHSVSQLHTILSKSVEKQLVADVPVGAFLSGGLDSSTVVAIMQSLSGSPVQTFTVGFTEGDYDESKHAAKIAAHLGTCHHEMCLNSLDLIDLIPKIAEVFDEPFADSSQIPTTLVSKLASKHVKVVLSGDGADELFGGYNRYIWIPLLMRIFASVPDSLRKAAARSLLLLGPNSWDSVSKFLPTKLKQPALGDRIHKLGGLLSIDTLSEAYEFVSSQIEDPYRVLNSSFFNDQQPVVTWASEVLRDKSFPSLAQRFMASDVVSYMTDDILCKVDRSGMSNSLETRMPFLDHRVAEFAFALPERHKISGLQGKTVLRELLKRFLPADMTNRPKQGFALPIDSWLRGGLRDWSHDLLSENNLISQGWLRPDLILLKWEEHMSGRRNHQHFLWNILMLQSWCENWRGNIRGIA